MFLHGRQMEFDKMLPEIVPENHENRACSLEKGKNDPEEQTQPETLWAVQEWHQRQPEHYDMNIWWPGIL